MSPDSLLKKKKKKSVQLIKASNVIGMSQWLERGRIFNSSSIGYFPDQIAPSLPAFLLQGKNDAGFIQAVLIVQSRAVIMIESHILFVLLCL